MTAAGVGPQAAGMILLRMSPLQHQPPRMVADDYGNGAVTKTALVGVELAERADWSILGVDQHDRIIQSVDWPFMPIPGRHHR